MPDKTILPVRVNPICIHPDERRHSLNGEWSFRLDPKDRGLTQKWFQDHGPDWEPIEVPGSWQGQGFGSDADDEVWDFKLRARIFRATYTGTGWYRKTFAGPEVEGASRLWLRFGGVHPSAEVWLNDQLLGRNGLPFVPFGFEITNQVRRGEPNHLAVRVHEANREYGFAYSWQGNWSGLYRGVELVTTGPQCLDQVWFHPDADRGMLGVNAQIDGIPTHTPLALEIRVRETGQSEIRAQITHRVEGPGVRFEMPFPSPRRWSPDSPNLYEVDVRLLTKDRVLDAQTERIGFVKLSTRGREFLINDEPYYMRGTGDFLSCPETGCPDTDRNRWRRKLQALRDYGYNYVRCQSYVYGPEYCEMGSLGSWGGHTPWHVYQWPKPTPDHYPHLKRQWDAIVLRDANHPSANLYCMSNEYFGDTDFKRIAWQCYHDTRAIKTTALVIWTDGGYNPKLPADFINHGSDCFKPDELAKLDKPLIEHEFRWWSSYPDIRLTDRYLKGAVRPYAAEIARSAAREKGQEHLLEVYAGNSQRLQFIEAKAKMENCRRDNSHLAGICHFNAMDANPSPQGIINEFYEKKCASAETWLQTNGDTVLLAHLNFEDRVLVGGQDFSCRLAISDFGHPPLKSGALRWRLMAGERELGCGQLEWAHTPYTTCPVGSIQVAIPAFERPTQVTLEARIDTASRPVRNEWPLWILPQRDQISRKVILYANSPRTGWLKTLPPTVGTEVSGARVWLTERLDDAVAAHVRSGGWAVVAATEGLVRPHAPNFGYVKYFFTPPANYGPYEDGQNGTVIQPHPLLGDFPHEGFADWQFFRMIETAPPLDLAPLGLADTEPVIRCIHRYPVCHALGYLLELAYGKGGFIFTALNLDWDLPEARYLLDAMIQRTQSPTGPAAPTLGEAALRRVMEATALPPLPD
jgi:hypothetical protein